MCKKGVENRGRKRVFLAVLFAKAACSLYLCTVNEVVRPFGAQRQAEPHQRQAEPHQRQAENGDCQLYNGPYKTAEKIRGSRPRENCQPKV